MNIEFNARKDVKVLLCTAAGTRGTPLPSDLSKRTRTSEEHRGWACFRTFPPGSYPEAPPGSGRETGSDGGGETRPRRPRRSGATQWCRWARPCLWAPRRGGGRGGNPRGSVTRVAAGRLREPVVCAEILGDMLGSAPLLPHKHARHVWRSPRCGSYPLLSWSGARSLNGPSETRQRRRFSRSLARLLCNAAPLTARVSRLCLSMASTDRFASVPGVCLVTGTPSPRLLPPRVTPAAQPRWQHSPGRLWLLSLWGEEMVANGGAVWP